jgi:hypothetical protein
MYFFLLKALIKINLLRVYFILYIFPCSCLIPFNYFGYYSFNLLYNYFTFIYFGCIYLYNFKTNYFYAYCFDSNELQQTFS